MKRLQCTKCDQVFWTELTQIDENQIGEGEWIQSPCPRCRTEWVIVSLSAPQKKRAPAPMRESKPAAKAKSGSDPALIKKLRKKLAITQKELAQLVEVTPLSVTFWETGKYKPTPDKVAKIKELAEKTKQDVRTMLESSKTERKPAPKKTGAGKLGSKLPKK